MGLTAGLWGALPADELQRSTSDEPSGSFLHVVRVFLSCLVPSSSVAFYQYSIIFIGSIVRELHYPRTFLFAGVRRCRFKYGAVQNLSLLW